MTPASAPAGFVIDDDAAVRASIQCLLKSMDLRSETLGTPLRKQAWEKNGDRQGCQRYKDRR